MIGETLALQQEKVFAFTHHSRPRVPELESPYMRVERMLSFLLLMLLLPPASPAAADLCLSACVCVSVRMALCHDLRVCIPLALAARCRRRRAIRCRSSGESEYQNCFPLLII